MFASLPLARHENHSYYHTNASKRNFYHTFYLDTFDTESPGINMSPSRRWRHHLTQSLDCSRQLVSAQQPADLSIPGVLLRKGQDAEFTTGIVHGEQNHDESSQSPQHHKWRPKHTASMYRTLNTTIAAVAIHLQRLQHSQHRVNPQTDAIPCVEELSPLPITT